MKNPANDTVSVDPMWVVSVAGVNLLTESNMIAGILLNAMFLLGTFTFAVVLGVVSDDISSEVKVCGPFLP